MSYVICKQQRRRSACASAQLASEAEQASLSLTWSETPEDTFSHDEAHLMPQHKSLDILIAAIYP